MAQTTRTCSALALAALLACAAPAAADPGDLAAYLRARAADAAGRPRVAAEDYAAALAAAPDNPVVAIRAYREGLKAGDLDLADRAAATLTRLGAPPDDAALQPLAEAARANDLPAMRAALAQLGRGPLAPLVPAVQGWVALAGGGDPFAPLAAAGRDAAARRLASLSRALLLCATGRTADGVAAVRALAGTRATGLALRLDAARLLVGRSEKAQAAALLAGDDPALAAARAHAKGARPTAAFGVSRLFVLLGLDLSDEDGSPTAVALGRAALRADPADDRARLLLADQLSQAGASDPALDALAGVDAKGSFGPIARTLRVSVLEKAGDPAAALAAAGRLAQDRRASDYDVQRYAEALLAAHRPDEAAEWMKRLADRPDAGWDVWLEYASMLEAAGRWPETRAALQKAVALGPDEPLALNYLGYAMIEHGEDPPAAEAMLAKAARLKPDDPSIADSLAWAWFRRGAVARALPALERAAAAEPDNAEIAEHLGDAYWASGRRYEARYAWRAAAVADPTAATRLQAKIADGAGAGAAKP